MMKLSFEGASILAINAAVAAYAATLDDTPADAIPDVPVKMTVPSAPSTPTTPVSAGVELDAAGVPWSADKHASTKAKVGSGLWRMKVGVKRLPEESESSPSYVKPGETAGSAADVADSGSPTPPANTPAPPAAPTPPAEPGRPTEAGYTHDNGDGTEQWYVNGAWDGGKHVIPGSAPAAVEEEDEFAAFRAAAGAGTPAAASARTWTDADLAKLCNQAALTVNDPTKVKDIIVKYVEAGGVPHSRNIPADQRENFAREVENAFGIQYAA